MASSLSKWYCGATTIDNSDVTRWYPAEPSTIELAFQTAIKDLDPAKLDQLMGGGHANASAVSLEQIQQTVSTTLAKYASSHKNNKAKKWLTKLTGTLHAYANITDMLGQQQYVSIVYGAMKMLVMATVNHEQTMTVLIKALSQIGEALPRVELATALYPTEKMRQAVEKLYGLILSFLIRAHQWSKEPSLRHVLHSFTKPVALQYGDLLEEIRECSKNIDQLALSGSQAELRDMHIKLNLIMTRLDDQGANIHQGLLLMSGRMKLKTSWTW